jgi:SAM-dependent methyltransferase
MRRDVVELRQFYAGPLGRAARDMLGRKLTETWGDVNGLDILGLGYATPILERFTRARRVVAAMPAEQGVEAWPSSGPGNRTCLTRENALPFPNALFDRILVVHGLEESDDPLALLREVWRVMAPSGRVVLAAAARSGVWCHAEATPNWSRSPGRGLSMRRRSRAWLPTRKDSSRPARVCGRASPD